MPGSSSTVVYESRDDVLVVLVAAVGQRREIYRGRPHRASRASRGLSFGQRPGIRIAAKRATAPGQPSCEVAALLHQPGAAEPSSDNDRPDGQHPPVLAWDARRRRLPLWPRPSGTASRHRALILPEAAQMSHPCSHAEHFREAATRLPPVMQEQTT